jgi:hypothetical protein
MKTKLPLSSRKYNIAWQEKSKPAYEPMLRLIFFSVVGEGV